MKTAEEIAFMYPASGGKMNVSDVYKAMEAYHAQFQTTEKTANWDSFDKVVAVVKNAIIGFDEQEQDTTDLARCITGALIQSGYIQSDSVDADMEPFLEFVIKERDSFVKEFLSVPTTTKRRVMVENLLIAYDQMKERLAGSKVKPVNEKMREALEKYKDACEYALNNKHLWDETAFNSMRQYADYEKDKGKISFMKHKFECVKRLVDAALSTAPEINHPDK